MILTPPNLGRAHVPAVDHDAVPAAFGDLCVIHQANVQREASWLGILTADLAPAFGELRFQRVSQGIQRCAFTVYPGDEVDPAALAICQPGFRRSTQRCVFWLVLVDRFNGFIHLTEIFNHLLRKALRNVAANIAATRAESLHRFSDIASKLFTGAISDGILYHFTGKSLVHLFG